MWKRGFTLIELLVVIAIIAILAAILFPVFARAREKARQTACLNNCKQMGLAVLMYADDYDEMYVPSFTRGYCVWRGSSFSYTLWFMNIQPYVKNEHICVCPSAYSPGAFLGDDYGVNYSLCRTLTGGGLGTTMAEVEYPAETLLLADSDYCRNPSVYATSNAYVIYPPGCTSSYCFSGFMPARHNGGANIVFADGHAKWHALQDDPNCTQACPVQPQAFPSDVRYYP